MMAGRVLLAERAGTTAIKAHDQHGWDQQQYRAVPIRAGVHTGEVELIDGEIGGIGVTICARVAARAGPSEVLVTSTVKDLAAGSGLSFEDAGEHELKGVPDRWRLYRVASA